MSEPISKLEGARRQLEVAIEMYFDGMDSLAIHTLAWAAFKVLFDVYPHHSQDGFDKKLDELVKQVGWKQFASVANFLKHADRDPDAFLHSHHPEEAFILIGLATLLYKQATGRMTVKMMGFDYWLEWIATEELGIEEVDQNAERVAKEAERRKIVKGMPYDERLKVGREKYRYFLENYDAMMKRHKAAREHGKSITDLLDDIHAEAGRAAKSEGSALDA